MAARTHRSWYVSRKKVEEDSPSRRDGIALEAENALRISCSNFLQELGTELNLPEQTIATATLYCNRFFLLKSHKNINKWAIAAGCMNMACRAERTPLQSEKDIVIVSYEMLRKYNPASTHMTITKEMIEEGVKIALRGDELVLTTLDFDIYVSHPYKRLHDTLKKFQGPLKNEFYQYARHVASETWLKTSLCLQYKPEHIAGAAIYLATQRFKESIQYYGEKFWWHEFDVPPQRLKDIGEHMLEEYANIQKPLSPEILGYWRVDTANLYNRSVREEQEEFMQYLNLPDEPELKYPADDHEKDDQSDQGNGNRKYSARGSSHHIWN